jgi:Phosphoenolpyruvate carboxylase
MSSPDGMAPAADSRASSRCAGNAGRHCCTVCLETAGSFVSSSMNWKGPSSSSTCQLPETVPVWSAMKLRANHLLHGRTRVPAYRDMGLRISGDKEVAQRFAQYCARLNPRLPTINEVNRGQVELLRRFRTAEDELTKEQYKSALLLSINCIAAGLGATG